MLKPVDLKLFCSAIFQPYEGWIKKAKVQGAFGKLLILYTNKLVYLRRLRNIEILWKFYKVKKYNSGFSPGIMGIFKAVLGCKVVMVFKYGWSYLVSTEGTYHKDHL